MAQQALQKGLAWIRRNFMEEQEQISSAILKFRTLISLLCISIRINGNLQTTQIISMSINGNKYVENLFFCRLKKANFSEKMKYISKWVSIHIEDCDTKLKKPVLFTEFGLSSDHKDYDPAKRHIFYKSIYDAVHNSAKNNGAGGGALIWQFLARGMEKYNDDFGIFPDSRQPMYELIKHQSCRIAEVNYKQDILKTPYKDICQKN